MHEVSVSSGDLHPPNSWFGVQHALYALCQGRGTEVSWIALMSCKDKGKNSLL